MRKVFALHGELSVLGLDAATKGLRNFDDKLKKASRTLAKTGRDFQRLGTTFTKTLTLPLTLAAGAAIKFGADFEKSMTTSLAIMGNVSDTMKKDMSDTAREVAKTSTRSASDVAKAYYYLASAGYDAAQSISALPKVTKFAEAGQFDLQLATDLLTDAMSALGLASKDVAENERQLVRTSDVLVKANTLANASVQQFSEALTNKAGAALRILGKSVEEGVAVLAAYADQGVKGAEAGSQLGIVLRDLQKAALNNGSAFKKSGVDVYDAAGEMRNMSDIMSDLEGAIDGMSDAQKKATLSTLGFQEKSISSLMTLIGTSEKIRDYETALRNAAGTTDEVANKQLQNLGDQLKILKNRLIDVGIEISQSLLPILKNQIVPMVMKWADGLKDLADKFNKLSPSMKESIVKFVAMVAVAGPLLIVIGKIATALAGLRTTVLLLNTAILANPFVLAATAVGIFAAAIYTAVKRYQDLQLEHEKFVAMTTEDADKKKFIAGYDAMLKKMEQYVKTGMNESEVTEALATDIDKLTASAKELKYEISGTVEERATALSQIANEIKQVRNIRGEVVKYTGALKKQKIEQENLNSSKEELSKEELKRQKKLYEEWEAIQNDRRNKDVEDSRAIYTARIKLEQEYDAIQKTRRDRDIEESRAIFEQKMEQIRKEKEARENLIAGAIYGVNEFFNTVSMFQENRLIEIDNEATVERQRIENSMLSEQEKQKAIETLDKRTEMERKKIVQRSAKLEKAQGIFNVAISTAEAIMNVWKVAMDLPPPASFIYGGIGTGIIAGLAAAQIAAIASRPVPMASGGLVKSGNGGILANIGEGREDELIVPLKTGVQTFVDALVGKINQMAMTNFAMPQPVPALAGGGQVINHNWRIGTLVADDSGIRELERRMSYYRYSEAQRMGATG